MKKIITIILAILLVLSLCACGSSEDHTGQVKTPAASSSQEGRNYEDVAKDFESRGFTNIKFDKIEDLVLGWLTKDGEVEEVSVGGDVGYSSDKWFPADIEVIIRYHTFPEEKEISESESNENSEISDPTSEESNSNDILELSKIIPKDTAKRVVIVAMTNSQATDVLDADGGAYDPNKFHTYDDIGDFFMTIDEDGKWSALNETTWHVEGIVLRVYNNDIYLKVTGNIKMDGENYILFNVDRIIASKEYIDSSDPSKINSEHFEPSDANPFLTVPSSLIETDRDELAANKKMTEKEKRQDWINAQFHWWDGRHIALSDIIKENLNDKKSFKHVEANYIDICDEERQQIVNETLKNLGSNERVEIGDLFVMETFTAKNAFNATIKNTAYGIVSTSGNVLLVGID